MEKPQQTVVVLGLGYVGCVTAACLAELGHSVIGVDRDGAKVKNITEGRAPFYEPGLEALVESGVRSGCLRATTSASEPLRDADIVMACVGTPSERNGNLGLDQLKRAVEEIAARLNAWLELPEADREAAREALAATVGRLWSWEGVARTVVAASKGQLEHLPRVGTPNAP